MRKALAVLFVSLMACAAADARPRHWYTDWKMYAGVAGIAGPLIADGVTTCNGLAQGGVESNGFARGSHSCAKVSLQLAAAAGYYTAIHIFTVRYFEHDPRTVYRDLSLIDAPIIVCAIHCSAAVTNANNTR
jgi:hypothetical protein